MSEKCEYLTNINDLLFCLNPKYEVCFRVCGYSENIKILDGCCKSCVVFYDDLE